MPLSRITSVAFACLRSCAADWWISEGKQSHVNGGRPVSSVAAQSVFVDLCWHALNPRPAERCLGLDFSAAAHVFLLARDKHANEEWTVDGHAA